MATYSDQFITTVPTPTGNQPAPIPSPYLGPVSPGLPLSGDKIAPKAVTTSQPAITNYNNAKTTLTQAEQDIQNQLVNKGNTQATANANDPIISAALSATSFDQLLKANPAAAYYRSNGIKPTDQQLQQFVASFAPPSKTPALDALNNVMGGSNAGTNQGGTGSPQTSSNGVLDSAQAARDKLNEESQKELNDFNAKVAQINQGTFPLTASQQAQIDSVRAAYDRAIRDQKVANQNYEGGVQNISIARGTSRYAPELALGAQQAAINEGIQKVADLDSQANATISALKNAFLKDDYSQISDAYERFTKFQDDRQKQIDKLQADTLAFQKDARDFSYKVAQDDIKNKLDDRKLNNDEKQQLIDNAFKQQTIDLATYKAAQDKIDQDRNYQLKLREFNQKITGGGDGSALQIAANEYASTGKMPSWVGKDDATKVAILAQSVKQPPGRLIDAVTGLPATKLAASQNEGIVALSDVIKKLDAAKTAFAGEHTGLLGIVGNIAPSDSRIIYDSMKGEIISLLNKARSGQAVSEQEYARAVSKLPGSWNSPLWLGASGEAKIDALKSSLQGTLDTTLSINGLKITDEKTAQANATDRLKAYYTASPENAAKVNQLVTQNPNLTAEDVVQIIGQ